MIRGLILLSLVCSASPLMAQENEQTAKCEKTPPECIGEIEFDPPPGVGGILKEVQTPTNIERNRQKIQELERLLP